jgi:pyrroline-5-carboxylate reductase
VKGKNVAFIGAGAMAEAMISGLLQKNTLTADQILVSNRSDHARLLKLKELYRIQISTCKKTVLENADIVILAMKPKDIVPALDSIREHITKEHLVISVIAGVTMDFILYSLGDKIPIVRAMPNTSSEIGYSATTIAGGVYAKVEHIEIAESLFQAIGTVTRVQEDDLHVTTGLAGSGPAYIYYIAEGMEQAAKEFGLNEQITRHLIAQTLLGAGQMLLNDNVDLGVLRKNVTSPGGTTEAGINELQKSKVQDAFTMCIKSAVARSKELSTFAIEQGNDKVGVDNHGI